MMSFNYLPRVLHLVFFGLSLCSPAVLASQIPASLTVINTGASSTFSTIFTLITPTPTLPAGAVAAEIHGAGYSGALAPTPEAPPPGIQTTKGPAFFTFAYTNLAGVDLTTTHDKNPGVPDPSNGFQQPGIMKNGAVASVVAPTGWAGKISFNVAGKKILGDESLIEAAYKLTTEAWAYGVVDVSYVDGYTVPITCKCRSSGKFLSGCVNPKLWQQSSPCPSPNGEGACKNPMRGTGTKVAHPWFQPCQGLAYTFDDDNDAVSSGECQSGIIDCEIHPK